MPRLSKNQSPKPTPLIDLNGGFEIEAAGSVGASRAHEKEGGSLLSLHHSGCATLWLWSWLLCSLLFLFLLFALIYYFCERFPLKHVTLVSLEPVLTEGRQ